MEILLRLCFILKKPLVPFPYFLLKEFASEVNLHFPVPSLSEGPSFERFATLGNCITLLEGKLLPESFLLVVVTFEFLSEEPFLSF